MATAGEQERTAGHGLEHGSIIEVARQKGLAPALLYQAVIELAAEGLLTATCLDAAAWILLTQLGLPRYFFRNLSHDGLKRVLRAIAGNLHRHEGRLILRSEVSEARFDVDGGVQARIATPANLERMEAVLNPMMAGHRVAYYFGREHEYHTYIIHPETCKAWDELGPGEPPFAFAQVASGPPTPRRTLRRYVRFLQKSSQSAVPLVQVSRAADTDETRIMFREDFGYSIVPVVRRLAADDGFVLSRAYWETYRTPAGRVESICSLYLAGRPVSPALARLVRRLRALLAVHSAGFEDLYVRGVLTFEEFVFAVAAAAFAHTFIHKETGPDRDIMAGLQQQRLRDALARQIHDSARAEYTRGNIEAAIRGQPGLLKELFALFDARFNPARQTRRRPRMEAELAAFRRRVAVRLADDRTAADILDFMTHLVTHVLRTNFYQERKRVLAFRLAPAVLDPLVFEAPVYGLFFVVGFYAIGTHMRAADIARGGLRLIRVTPANHDNELDGLALLNYALGPVAQRLKHKDIAESGAKGVIVPFPEYAEDGLNATLDLTEGILDLLQPSPEIVDYLGRREAIFFGPDEGTAHFMDAVAQRARSRGYRHWRTITTGKSIGVPHEAYGLLRDGRVFGLLPHGEAGTELVIEGRSVLTTTRPEELASAIGGQIDASGMTTVGVVACLRRVLAHLGLREEDARMMLTGGPDGDLGANQIQSARGRICLLADSGAVLFDPDGLRRDALLPLAMARHTSPRLNSAAYPEACLSPGGFRVRRTPGAARLPDGTVIEDGGYFHRTFLTDPASRAWVEAAPIEVFVPCGGAKDTINAGNVRAFLEVFRELRVIVEGANVFFDDTARDVIARETPILQIRDSTANKGGVTSSSLAEVLAAFLLGETYERVLVEDAAARCDLVRAVLRLIARNAEAETAMLLELHSRTGTPLYLLSRQTSERLLALQEWLDQRLPAIHRCRPLVEATLRAYIPDALLERLGMARALRVLGRPDLQAYRDAILTKRLASLALYRFAGEWEDFLGRLRANLIGELLALAQGAA